MYDIIIKTDTDSKESVDSDTITALVVEGIKWGVIDELHSCVEYVNEMTSETVNIGGNDVEGTFKKVVDDLVKLNSKIDSMASSGKTVEEMSEIFGEFFTYADIEVVKIEVYGSVADWIAAITSSEV